MSKEKMKEWKLDDEYTLHFGKNGVSLEYKSTEVHIKNVRGKNQEVYKTRTHFYGSLYQALKGYVHKRLSNGDFEDIHNIKGIISEIDFVMSSIEKKYKIVKVAK
jgi:putative alpha-1,2-mannosidase